MQPIVLTVVTAIITGVQSAAPVFRADAADKVQAGFKRSSRGGKTRIDLTRIEVNWQPFAMVEDKATVDSEGITLEVKVGDSDWNKVDQIPIKRGGGKYKLILSDILPCKNHLLRFTFVSPEGEEAVFNDPFVVEAASAEDIASSGDFTPSVPTNMNVVTMNGEVTISWDPVDCVTGYEISYKKISDDDSKYVSEMTEETSVTLAEGIDTCSDYEVIVSSVTGESYSDGEPIEFDTPPAVSAAQKLSPKITPRTDSLEASWDAWEQLSCVESYIVNLCKQGGECGEDITLTRDDSLPAIEYKPEQILDQCSAYSLNIQPIYPGQDLQEVSFPFDTQSPPLESVLKEIQPVEASAGDEQMITITWSPVQCATGYEVFQHVHGDGGDWETIGETSETQLSIKGIPCTEYKYGVKFTIDGRQSEIIEAAEPVVTHLPLHEAYAASNLIVTPSIYEAELSWDHALCISSYRVRVCRAETEDCHEEEIVIDEPSQHNVTKIVDGLLSCSDYTLQIYATSNEQELGAELQTFYTFAPPASAPENVTVTVNSETNQIDISFNSVECSSAYRVYRTLDEGDNERILEITELTASVPIPDPCSTYSFSVSSVVGGEESKQSPLLGDTVPPISEGQGHPEIKVEEVFNTTAIFMISLPESNKKCQVESYHIKYQNVGFMEKQELMIDSSSIQDGRIILDNFPGAADNGMKIEGRIKYPGFDSWSPWVSTADPVPAGPLKSSQSNTVIVPIVIGIIVATAVLVIVIFFVVKRKTAQAKYESEKVNNAEESQKLKDNPEV